MKSKENVRVSSKIKRSLVHNASTAPELIRHFPALKFRNSAIAAYWPLPDEIDVRPLMRALFETSHVIGLPCVVEKNAPLIFRQWQAGDDLKLGRYGVYEPQDMQRQVAPDVVLLPLLAFTPDGKRLGYGGGYYDRTLALLRRKGHVFACGVAYAGQEVPELSTDEYDQPLDGILTERYFRTF